MSLTWRDSIYKQRKSLAQILREPLEQLTNNCIPMWGHRESIENLFLVSFSRIPYCDRLYALDKDGIQVSESIGRTGIQPGFLGRDRSQDSFMREVVPAWGFLLSDAYLSMNHQHPSFTALQLVRTGDGVLGYIGADFDLRDLPITAGLYLEPGEWRQSNHTALLSNLVFRQSRSESSLEDILPVVESLLVERGVFQCQIHFASCQVTVWTLEDPYRYQVLDYAGLTDSNILQDFPRMPYPYNAKIPRHYIARILDVMKLSHVCDQAVYLRFASLNIFTGQISFSSSQDDSHYVSHDEFLTKQGRPWFNITDTIPRPIPI